MAMIVIAAVNEPSLSLFATPPQIQTALILCGHFGRAANELANERTCAQLSEIAVQLSQQTIAIDLRLARFGRMHRRRCRSQQVNPLPK